MYYVQPVLVATFAFGLFLHGATLVAGRAWVLENVLTPIVDVGLLVPILYTTVVLWRLRHRAHHPRRWHRPVYLAMTFYMAVTVVVHLETLFTWQVNYVHRFPHWYSAFILPVQFAMLVFAARLRFRRRAAEVRSGSPSGTPSDRSGSSRRPYRAPRRWRDHADAAAFRRRGRSRSQGY